MEMQGAAAVRTEVLKDSMLAGIEVFLLAPSTVLQCV